MSKFLLLVNLLFLSFQASTKTPNHFKTYEKTPSSLILTTSDGTIKITPLTTAAFEVEFLPIGEQNPPSNALVKVRKNVRASVEEKDNLIKYKTDEIEAHIIKEPLAIRYFYNDKFLLSEEKGFFDSGDKRGFRFNLTPDEKLTGGGSRAGGINRRGKHFQLYNKASYGYEETADLMYYSMPVVISSRKYMLAFDNGASGWLDLGATEKNILQFDASGGRWSYIISAADTWKDLSINFTEVTGRQPMLPRWALGNIASRMGYHSQREVENLVEKYEEDDIPLDAVVLDLFWFGPDVKGHMGNLDWHRDSFPEGEKMVQNFDKKGIKTILITEPFVVENTSKYEEVIKKELVGKTPNGKPYLYPFFFGNTTLLDVFKPETKSWFWDIYKKHTESGVAGWWGDLGEPEVHPDDMVHAGGSGKNLHNLYGHEWAKLVFEGYEKDFPNRRPVILMRSGFIGSQRYGLVPWSGDVNRSWGGLKPQVEIGLTMGMQGLAYMHSDLGGFAGNYQDSELYLRWLQYGVFQPIFRTHAQEGVPAEPVFWDDATKAIAKQAIELRYRLMPYNYTLMFQNSQTGVPMMRPLVYAEDNLELFENDKTYLWGDDILVSPVVEKGAKKQLVYFPEGSNWFDFFTGEKHEGDQEKMIDLVSKNIPVFVKAGSFIPLKGRYKNDSKYFYSSIEVVYYHDFSVKKNSGFWYEDDGKTKNAFAKKQYETLQFEYEETEEFLKFNFIPERHQYDGMPRKRRVEFKVKNLPPEMNSIESSGAPVGGAYLEKLKEAHLFFDMGDKPVEIRIEK